MSYMEFFNPNEEIKNIVNWIKEYFTRPANFNTKAIIGLSGGKDSTIAATLLVNALGPERVIGVAMPQGEKSKEDTEIAKELADILGIRFMIVDIESTVNALVNSMAPEIATKEVLMNIPPRVRMTTLYAIAQKYHGRVCNTCNRSEDYVGYATKFGDTAGDFGFLKSLAVREILAIGEALNIPLQLVHRPPADGLTGKTDEEVLGVTYAEIDDWLLENERPEKFKFNIIRHKHIINEHKEQSMPIYCRKQRQQDWEDKKIEF